MEHVSSERGARESDTQAGGVAVLERKPRTNGKAVLCQAGLSSDAAVQHGKIRALLDAINQSLTNQTLPEALARLGAGTQEASKLLDISVTSLAKATDPMLGVVFFCSARRPKRFDLFNTQVGSLMDKSADVVDFVVTGRGPGMMSIPILHGRRLQIPTLGVPADIPAEHARLAPEEEPDIVLPDLHMPARKEVFLALGDVFVVLDSGLGGLDEVSEVLLRAQLQRSFGQQAEYPFLKRSVLPRLILVGSIWKTLMSQVIAEMNDQGTLTAAEIPFVSVIPDIEDLATVGAELILRESEEKKRLLSAS